MTETSVEFSLSLGDTAAEGRERGLWIELLIARVKQLLHQYPTFGYRPIWAMLRFRQGVRVNAKAVYRVLKKERWLVDEGIWTPAMRHRLGDSCRRYLGQRPSEGG
ncbi:MAG: transposase [Myxococcaceae bacterium]